MMAATVMNALSDGLKAQDHLSSLSKCLGGLWLAMPCATVRPPKESEHKLHRTSQASQEYLFSAVMDP